MAANDDDWLNLNEEWLDIKIDEAAAVTAAQPKAEREESSDSEHLDDEFSVLDEAECVETCTQVQDKAIDRCRVETLDKAVDATQFVETMIQAPPAAQKMDKAVDVTPEFEPAKEAQTVPVEVITKKKAARSPEEIILSYNKERCSALEKAMERAAENLTESLNRALFDFVGETPPTYQGRLVNPGFSV